MAYCPLIYFDQSFMELIFLGSDLFYCNLICGIGPPFACIKIWSQEFVYVASVIILGEGIYDRI